jgi:hypothetical protein
VEPTCAIQSQDELISWSSSRDPSGSIDQQIVIDARTTEIRSRVLQELLESRNLRVPASESSAVGSEVRVRILIDEDRSLNLVGHVMARMSESLAPLCIEPQAAIRVRESAKEILAACPKFMGNDRQPNERRNVRRPALFRITAGLGDRRIQGWLHDVSENGLLMTLVGASVQIGSCLTVEVQLPGNATPVAVDVRCRRRIESTRGRPHAIGCERIEDDPATASNEESLRKLVEAADQRSALIFFGALRPNACRDSLRLLEHTVSDGSVAVRSIDGEEGFVVIRNGRIVEALTRDATRRRALEIISGWRAGGLVLSVEPPFEAVAPRPREPGGNATRSAIGTLCRRGFVESWFGFDGENGGRHLETG